MKTRIHGQDGLYKRCACHRRAWTKCPHPWYFDFYRRGRRHRYSLHKLADKPPDYVMPKGEAEGLRDEYRGQIRKGTFVDPNDPTPPLPPDARLTLDDVIDRYIKRHVDTPTRRKAAAQIMKWHLAVLQRTRVPSARGTTMPLGNKFLDEITKADVEAVRDARRQTAIDARAARDQWEREAAALVLKGKTIERPKPRIAPGVQAGEVGINRLLARLRHVFSWAIGEGFTDVTPFKRHGVAVIRLQSETPRHRRLAPGEEEALLRHAMPPRADKSAPDGHLHALIVAALETGCRLGELLGLQWRDVELGADASGALVARRLLLPASKTKTAETRRVPVSSRLRAVLDLRRHASDGKEHKPIAYVFGNEVGERIGSIKTAWRATCRRAGISDLHFHDLRREFASRLRETPGVSDHMVRDWLGHANITTTSRYLATSDPVLDHALRQFEEHRKNATPIDTSTGPASGDMPATDREKPLTN